MSEVNLDTILDQALNRPEQERAILAEALIASLEKGPEPGVEKAWQEEINRRITELDSGMVSAISWEQVKRELHGGD